MATSTPLPREARNASTDIGRSGGYDREVDPYLDVPPPSTEAGPASLSSEDTATWWTTTDVATYLGMSPATVGTYLQRGKLPPPDATKDRMRFWRPDTITAWAPRNWS